MAKPLGPKSQLIRQAIADNPGMGNKEIAETLMDDNARLDDKIKVTPQDVAQQKQQMKKAGIDLTAAKKLEAAKPEPKKRGRKPGQVATSRPAPAAAASPVDLLDKAFDLAKQCGGVQHLKRLVDRIAEMQG